MKSVVALPNGALKLIQFNPLKVVDTTPALTRTPTTVSFMVFDPQVPSTYRYNTGSVILSLTHSPVLYRVSINPYKIEKVYLPSKHPIVLLQLAQTQTPIMKSSSVSVNYKFLTQTPVIVLQGDGTLTRIIDGKIESSIQLKKWDLKTEELTEPLLVDEDNFDEDTIIDPVPVKGLKSVFNVGVDCVIASSMLSFPIRRYGFDGNVTSSPICSLKYISSCVIDEEVFMGTSEGILQRYSFEERKRKVISQYRKVYSKHDLAHPQERMDVREETHPMITATICDKPLISICNIPDSTMIAIGTSAGKVYLFDVKKNSVCACLKGPQGSVRLSCNGKLLVGVSLDRWMYVWNPYTRTPLSKVYLHRLPSAVILSN
ncbi:WD domain containing protein [Entamoeba marina]